jgi:hypothetical protein
MRVASVLALVCVTAAAFAQDAPAEHKKEPTPPPAKPAQPPAEARPEEHKEEEYVRIRRTDWTAMRDENLRLTSDLLEAGQRLSARSTEVNELRHKLDACKSK